MHMPSRPSQPVSGSLGRFFESGCHDVGVMGLRTCTKSRPGFVRPTPRRARHAGPTQQESRGNNRDACPRTPAVIPQLTASAVLPLKQLGVVRSQLLACRRRGEPAACDTASIQTPKHAVRQNQPRGKRPGEQRCAGDFITCRQAASQGKNESPVLRMRTAIPVDRPPRRHA